MSKLTTKNTILINCLESMTSDEVDFKLYDDILGKNQVDILTDSNENIYVKTTSIFHLENQPLSISYIEDVLKRSKEIGATHVSVSYNCDHPDYTFTLVKASKVTDSDLIEIIKKDKKRNKIEAERLRRIAENYLKEAESLEKDE